MVLMLCSLSIILLRAESFVFKTSNKLPHWTTLKEAPNSNNNVAYARYWDDLLLQEHQEKVAQYRERRRSWSRSRLENSGMSLFGASAEPDSDLFGDKIIRIFKKGETRLRDRFSRGDVLLLTRENGQATPPRECLVIDVGKDWITAGVGATWPEDVWESRKLPGFCQVRLDRSAPKAPLKAQRIALEVLRKGKAGKAVNLMANLWAGDLDWVDSAAASPYRFDKDDIEEIDLQNALGKAKNATAFRLNKSQEEAIVWALSRQISLIRGPPGTGKTKTAALLISTAMRLHQQNNGRVLAVAHSNGAADVLLQALLQMGVPAIRVGRPASVSIDVQHRTVVAMAEKHPEIKRLREQARDTSLDPHMRSAAQHELRKRLIDVQQSMAKTAPIVVASCIGAYQLIEDDHGVNFPLVVLDEAAQTTEPALVCALAAARAEQIVLVGDTRQLPPTISSIELRHSLGVSPMARLEKSKIEQTTLRVQYRMPPALLEHPSSYFYNGLVSSADEIINVEASLPQGFEWPAKIPLAFVQVTGSDLEVTHDFGGKSNPAEAELVTSIVSNLLKAGDVEARNIAVISPYKKQVQRIRSELSLRRQLDVKVGTVDSFQGQETDIVVFSCVRSNEVREMGFLRDARRLCVAITRAKRGLIIVGDKQVLQTCHHWAALLESCGERSCMMEADDLGSFESEEESSNKKNIDPQDVEQALNDILNDAGKNDELYGLFTAPTDKV